MNKSSPTSERGQAIVLIVVAMVALLGFTALAVDGSMIYSDRRHAQNSADAASLAAGTGAAGHMDTHHVEYSTWTASPPTCTGQVLGSMNAGITAGTRRALDNDFVVDNEIASDQNGLIAECKQENINAPTVGGGSTTIFVDKYADLIAQITDDTDTAFAHFVFGGALRNTVTAVTRIRPRQPLAYGYAIVALNPNACSGNSNGVNYHGLGPGGGLSVIGGGVFSNGCMDVDGNANISIEDAAAHYFYTANNNNLDQIQVSSGYEVSQLVDNDAYRIPFSAYDIQPPDCSGHEVTSRWVNEYWDQHHTPIPSGLYCVTDELRINGGDHVEADAVTFVLYNGATVNGSAYVRMTMALPGSATDAIPGLVMYQPSSSQATIQFSGNQDTVFRGTVLAPRGNLDFNGDGFSRGFFSQLIGWNVRVGGSSDTEIIYRAQKQVQKPATLELNK